MTTIDHSWKKRISPSRERLRPTGLENSMPCLSRERLRPTLLEIPTTQLRHTLPFSLALMNLNIDSFASKPAAEMTNATASSRDHVEPSDELFETPAPTDITCGRGNLHAHEGNKKYQRIVDDHNVAYRAAGNNMMQKQAVIDSVYSQIYEEERMRFIERDSTTRMWRPAMRTKTQIKNKIRQKLCDSTNPLKMIKSSHHGSDAQDVKVACKARLSKKETPKPPSHAQLTLTLFPVSETTSRARRHTFPIGTLPFNSNPTAVPPGSQLVPLNPFSSIFCQDFPSQEMIKESNRLLVARIKADLVRRNPGLA